ncbi:glycosyltransferase family 2 protein [Haloarchaeobius sp. FL176]|uniref:glycosyltransferase family 2 protein n=1 Tax=Haloarchaeobius sp. FL176 TaxID=2967129 RepID=UPI0021490FC2|nr:glycosyltransferase family 2 protein [Haloarchaeobius sp. FL176]
MSTVSVVIPTYNEAAVLHRSIESVLAQTYEDFELLVVDDGSTDETAAAVRSYDDERVRYLAHGTNRGASAARNTGIEHATGEYVAFLDADDEWYPRKLERQVAELSDRAASWVAVYCGVDLVTEDDDGLLDEWLPRSWTRLDETEGAEGGQGLVKDVLLDRLHTSAGSTLLVRRPVVEAIDGFDESFDRFQDSEFLIRVLQQGQLAYVDETLVARYDTGRPDAEAIEAADEAYLEKFADTVDELERRGYDIQGTHDYFLAKFYFQEGELGEGFRHLRNACWPEARQYPGLLYSVATGTVSSLVGGRPRRS